MSIQFQDNNNTDVFLKNMIAYENKIKEKETVYNAANPSGVADTMTIEERVKDQLDNLLDSKIYNAKLELSAPSNISGLPY